MTATARDWIDRLHLAPHPEGGWYREVYRSAALTQSAGSARGAVTTIYYLLERGQSSRWHAVDADEIWHFYAGEPLDLARYSPVDRKLATTRLAHEPPGVSVAVVSADEWQAARTLGSYSLVGCTVAPAFEFAGFRFVADLPEHEHHFVGAMRSWRDLL
jgi:hypothetical protein